MARETLSSVSILRALVDSGATENPTGASGGTKSGFLVLTTRLLSYRYLSVRQLYQEGRAILFSYNSGVINEPPIRFIAVYRVFDTEFNSEPPTHVVEW